MPRRTHHPSLKRDPLCHAAAVAFLAACGIGIHVMTLSAPSSSLVISGHINPNEAGLPALMSLPGIGQAKARAIVDYRARKGGPGRAVFTEPRDLAAVPGLGPVSVQRLRPYLRFSSSVFPGAPEKSLDPAADSIIMPGD